MNLTKQNIDNINDKIRTKKLYKSGDTSEAYKDSNGEVVVPSMVALEIAAVSDITELLNDHDNYSKSIYLLKEIENIRLDVEELHTFIKNAFGKDSTSAASKGAKGDTGLTGPQGPAGANGADGADGNDGSDGKNGADGNSHLSGVTSIAFNPKSNRLQVNIGGTVYNFAPTK